jgi:xylulokinase
MTLVAGVDSSTQSCKVVIVDAHTGVLVREGRASHPGGTEVDPSHWWSALTEAIAAAGGLDDVAAISVGGQQHGMVVLDAQGHVIRPALLWNDTRSAAAADELIAHFGADYLATATGSVPVASFTSTKLRWLRTHEPDNAARVAAVALPHDWLSWRLAGFGPQGESELGPDFSALATDRSEASGTGYFNSQTNAYLDDVLDFALGHVPALPRIVLPGEIAGRTSSGVLIACGAGDNAAAALGLGASAGDVVVSLGTSGTVFSVSATPTNDTQGTIAGFASASGSFLPLVCTLNAARVLDSFASLLGVSHTELGELALRAHPGADGVVLVPYFEGERTPNLPDARASLVGLTLANNTRENLARAAVEGMLCGLEAGLRALLEAGVACTRVFVVGGAAANSAVQVAAGQIFGVPVVIPQPGEYVANGAARQAAHLATGEQASWPIATLNSFEAERVPSIVGNYRLAADRVALEQSSI